MQSHRYDRYESLLSGFRLAFRHLCCNRISRPKVTDIIQRRDYILIHEEDYYLMRIEKFPSHCQSYITDNLYQSIKNYD